MYLNKQEIAEELGISKSTVVSRIREMEESGRYVPTDIIRDGNLLWADWYAFTDWLTTRRMHSKGQPVAPYNRKKTAATVPPPSRIKGIKTEGTDRKDSSMCRDLEVFAVLKEKRPDVFRLMSECAEQFIRREGETGHAKTK